MLTHFLSKFFVPENDTDAVVEKIKYLLDTPEKADELGTNARKLAFGKHSLEVTNEMKAKVYKEMLT